MPQLVAHNLTKEEFNKFRNDSSKSMSITDSKEEKSNAVAVKEEEEPSRFDKFVEVSSEVFVEKPIKSFCSCFGFILVVVIIVIATGNMDNSEDSEFDWNVPEDEYTTNYDMLLDLQDRTDLIVTDVDTRTVPLSDLSMIVTYEHTKGSDIFTAANLQRMCTIEAKWFSDAKYADYCPLDSNTSTTCSSPTESIVALFYGYNTSTWSPDCPLLSDDEVSTISTNLYANLSTSAGVLKYGFFAGSDFNKKGYTRRTRSLLRVGGPLEGYDISLDTDGDQKDQQKEYQNFFEKVADEWIDMLKMKGSFMRSLYRDDSNLDGKIDVVWYSWILNLSIFDDILTGDMTMVIFSVLFVWIWMNIHVESFLIASVGMFQIFMSLPFGRFFYSIMGQVKFFSILQSLVIFLVLGIGADDVFVLVDAWRQSENDIPRLTGEDEKSWLKRRMVSSYGRTMQSVFNTSFTTAMAFISTAISPIMPIAAFGIYATICIIVNYLFVITLTPPAVIIHHMYFKGFGPEGWCYVNQYLCFRCGGSKIMENASSDTTTKQHTTDEQDGATGIEMKSDFKPSQVPGGATAAVVVVGEEKAHEEHSIEVTEDTEILSKVLIGAYEAELPESWGKLKGLKYIAVLSVLCNVVMGGVLTGYASTLDLPKEPEQWFPLDHMTQKFILDSPKYLVGDSAAYPVVDLVWGTKDKLDRKDYNRWIPGKNRGTTKLDSNFDIADPDALTVISDSCAELEAKVCNAAGCKPIGYLVQPGTVICAVDEFEVWHQANYNSSIYDLGAGSADFYSRLLVFRENTSPTDYPSKSWADYIGVIDDEPVFIVVEGTMSMEYEVTNTELGDVLDVAKSLVNSLDTTSTARKVFLSSDIFSWYATQNGLLSGMLTGLAIAFPVAFLTLIFATQNMIIAFYAILTIGMIVASVLGAAALNGWALGISESIAAVIVVGFSVDYTIHLGHMYDHAAIVGYTDRSERTRYTILKMGGTVLAGAITTCGSGVFMFACQLTFFTKMAFLICNTIAFSLLYSLCFFVPLLYLIGPNDEDGYVSFEKIKSKFV